MHLKIGKSMVITWYLNIPYFELLDGVEEILPQIPTDKDVLVVCAKKVHDHGCRNVIRRRSQVAYLEGGMKSWSIILTN